MSVAKNDFSFPNIMRIFYGIFRVPSRGRRLQAELGKGLEDEGAEMGPRMRQRQLGGVDGLSSEVYKVDVNRPGSVPDRPDPSKIILNRMHSTRKVKRIKRRLENRHLIEELERGEFRRHVDRLGLNNRTRLHKPRLGQG